MKRFLAVPLALLVLTAALTLLLPERLEFSLADVRARASARACPVPLALVEIDRSSLEFYRDRFDLSWPWPRSLYGRAIDTLTRLGARAVVLDLVFTEPSTYEEEDQALVAALTRSGRVFLPLMYTPEQGPLPAAPLSPLPVPPGLVPVEWRGASLPIAAIGNAAAGLGDVSATPDGDGVNRRLRHLTKAGGVLRPSLSLAVARAIEPGLRVDGLPFRRDGTLPLRFYRSDWQRLPISQLIQDDVRQREGQSSALPAGLLRGKVVVIGATAAGLLDLRPNPLDPKGTGFELHATALANLLAGDTPKSPPRWIFWGGLLLVLILLNASLMRIRSLPWQGVLSLGVLLLVLAIAFFAYPLGWEVPMLPGLLGVVSAAASDMVRRYRQVRKEKRILKVAFQGYMSAELYKQVMKDPSSLRLGGEKRLVTVYFSDLAGFTTLSEKLDPEALVAVLNEYLGRMTDIIMAHGGFVNKFEGDAIMALWGAPLPDGEQADHALTATLACQRELAVLNAGWRERGLPELSMRTGLNSGEVVVGNVGSPQKKEYTVIGDAVNLASRLEGAGKNYGIHRTVGEATRNLASDRFVFRPLEKVRVKGKSQPVEIFELIGLAGEVGGEETTRLAAFDRARQLYLAGDFAAAAEAFAAIGGDPPSQTLAGRCREFLAAPPAAWDGTVTFTSK